VQSYASDNYPAVGLERRPLLFIAGDQDPLCAPAPLYRLAADAAGPSRVAVLSGNHSLESPGLPAAAAAEALRRNVQLAAMLVAEFVARHRKQ